MNSDKIKSILALLALTFLIACGTSSNPEDSPNGKADDPTDPMNEDAIYSCAYQPVKAAAEHCFASLDSNLKLKLTTTLTGYDRNPNWTPSLLQSGSFKRRYPLSPEQLSCLVSTVCRRN
jgi:hypothetical protein